MALYVRDKHGVLHAQKIPAYKGEKGEVGVTPNIQIGDVVTLEAGQQATVVRKGTDENPVFDFSIPKGETGSDGIFVGSIVDAPDHAQVVVNDDPTPYDLFFENANVDYMGNTYPSLKEKADADIEYLLRKFGTQHYEGTNITATDTYMKQVKSAMFKGVTKYIDKDTGEIIDTFQEGKNLELVSVKSPVLTTSNGSGGVITMDNIQKNKFVNVLSNDIHNTNLPLGVFESHLTSGETYIYEGINKCTNFVTNNDGGKQSWKIKTRSFYTEPNKADTTIVAGNYTGEIFITVDMDNLDKIRFRNVNDPINIESTTLTTPQDLILRGVGDVHDTVDLMTGEYIQRIGEIVLDGKEDWSVKHTSTNTIRYCVIVPDYKPNRNPNVPSVVCSKLPAKPNSQWANDEEMIEGGWANKEICIRLSKDKANSLEEFRAYLAQNPITVQYELETPIQKSPIDLKGQKVYSYDGTTHYTTKSLDGHPSPILSIDVPTNTTTMIARQRETIKHQEQKILEQEEVQNILIESQIAWYEQTLLSTLDLPNEKQLPAHIQKLYEVAYKRGIRTRGEEL